MLLSTTSTRTSIDFAVLDQLTIEVSTLQRSRPRRRQLQTELDSFAGANDIGSIELSDLIERLPADNQLLDAVAVHVGGVGELMSVLLAAVAPIINKAVCRRVRAVGLERQEAAQLGVSVAWQTIAEYSLTNPRSLGRVLASKIDNALKGEVTRRQKVRSRRDLFSSIELEGLSAARQNNPGESSRLLHDDVVGAMVAAGVSPESSELAVTTRLLDVTLEQWAAARGKQLPSTRVRRSRADSQARSAGSAVRELLVAT